MARLSRHSDCSYESVLLCEVIKELLRHLLFEFVLTEALDQIVLVDDKNHRYRLSVLQRDISVDLLLPAYSLLNGLPIADVRDDQRSEGPPAEELVDPANARILADQVPQLEPQLGLLYLEDLHRKVTGHRCLVVRVKFVLNEAVHDRGLPRIALSYHEYLDHSDL